jgi:hypothetical protein
MKLLSPLLLAIFLISCANPPGGHGQGDSVTDSTGVTENSPATFSNQDSIDSTGIEFGFCNKDGKKILMPQETMPDPSRFTHALTADHKTGAISYLKNKKATTEDNGRQNEFNFDNCAGYLFETNDQPATPDHSAVLMTSEFVSARKLVTINEPAKKELPASIKSRIENEKKRKIKNFRCLTLLEKDAGIYVVEFENKGDSALAALVYITPDKIVYQDFPAEYNDVSTWRVDDGGNFGVEYFDLLAVFEKDGKLEIITDWPGAEGIATDYLKENGSAFKSIKTQSRYTAPQ